MHRRLRTLQPTLRGVACGSHLGATITHATLPLTTTAHRGYGVLYRTTPVATTKTAASPSSSSSSPPPASSESPVVQTESAEPAGKQQPDADDASDARQKSSKKAHLKMGDVFKESSGVLVTTRGKIEGHRIVREVGIIVGSSVKSRHVGHDLWARVLGFFGRSVVSYAEMMVDSSAEATFNLMHEASKRGANAVLRVRYETAASSDPAVWSSTFSYTLAYGTAVVVKPQRKRKPIKKKYYEESDDEEEEEEEDD